MSNRRMSEEERISAWERKLAPLRSPRAYHCGLSEEDQQTLRDIGFRVQRLLTYDLLADAHALPPGLAAILRTYREQLLQNCASQPWARTGYRAKYGKLADTIASDIWPPGP